MNRIPFTCSKCHKTIQIQPEVFRRIYEGHDTCLTCRPTDSAKILTEEELNKYSRFSQQDFGLSQVIADEVIASHRELFKANAGLSFENMKLKKALKSIAESSTHLADSLRIQAHLTLEETK